MSLDINKFELELCGRAVKEAAEEARLAKAELDDDPLTSMIDIQREFKQLLDENQGDARFTPKFKDAIDRLARKEKRAKLRAETYNLSEVSDKKFQADWKYNQINSKFINLQYFYEMRNKKVK